MKRDSRATSRTLSIAKQGPHSAPVSHVDVSAFVRCVLQVAWVPGSFELPVVAQSMAASGQYSAIVCIGAVVSVWHQHAGIVLHLFVNFVPTYSVCTCVRAKHKVRLA